MPTLEEIKQSLLQLGPYGREIIFTWLSDNTGQTIAEPARPYGADHATRLLTVDEYLEIEETSPVRHEYVAGTLFAMCGVTQSHNLIAANLLTAIHTHLRGGPCRAYMSDVKLKLQAGHDHLFYYPDIMVSCSPETASDVYIEQSKLVIEVLSPSTERIDRREKALNYRRIATLEEYILIEQKRPQIEIQRRADDWRPTIVASPDARVEMQSIGLSLPLSQIYEQVLGVWMP